MVISFPVGAKWRTVSERHKHEQKIDERYLPFPVAVAIIHGLCFVNGRC